jgi:hypothetical protein
MSSHFSNEYIEQQIGKITQKFKVLQCVECAEAIKQWLKNNDIRGIKLRIKILGRGDFILSERWDGSQKSISQNGVHYGIEARGKVFDNLSRFGISREEWLQDFSCISGQFLIEEIEYF